MADAPGGFGTTSIDTIALKLDLQGKEDLKTADVYSEHLKQSFEQLGEAAERSRNKMAGLGQAGLQAGRALQDFSQGGIGGILNNIEGLSMALGGGAGLAGVMTAVGLAVWAAMPYLKDFGSWLADRRNDVPETRDALTRLNEELDKHKDRLEELRKQQKLTNDELSEFTTRTETQRRLEEEVEKERSKKADRDKLKKIGEKAPGEFATETAEILQAEFGGRQEELSKGIEANADAVLDDLQKQMRSAPEGSPQRAALFKRWNAVYTLSSQNKDRKAAIQDLMAGAMVKGDAGALRQILEVLPAGSPLRGGLEGALPEQIRAGEMSVLEAEQFGERASQAGKTRRERAKEYNERRRLMERNLNKATEAEIDNEESLEREGKQQKAEAKREETEAREAARKASAKHRLQEQADREEDRVARFAERANQQYGFAGSAGELQDVISEAVKRLPRTGGNIAAAVQQAVQAGYMHAMQQQQQDMMRLQAFSETRIQ